MARENPYTRLKRRCARWALIVQYPKRKVIFTYPKARHKNFNFSEVYQYVRAGEILGYDTILLTDKNDGLILQYKQLPGDPPWEIKQ